MERDEAVEQLPTPYQQVLTWLEEGGSQAEIAQLLGIDPSSVEPLVGLAEAKLARLTGDSASPDGQASVTGRPS